MNINNIMSEPDKLKTQINLSIAYIVFLFTILNTFPHIMTTNYGVGGIGLLDFSFIGFKLWKLSLYSLFSFLLFASIQITFELDNKILYKLSQVFFIFSIILMIVMLVFPISFLPY